MEVAKKEWLTLKEACEEARVCQRTLYDWRLRGLLKAYRPGGRQKILVRREELEQAILASAVEV